MSSNPSYNIEAHLTDIINQAQCEFTLIASLQTYVTELLSQDVSASTIIESLENTEELSDSVLDAITDYLISNSGQ